MKITEYDVGHGQKVVVRKDFYKGLWNIWYADSVALKWAGPFKTKGEAIERIKDVMEFKA